MPSDRHAVVLRAAMVDALRDRGCIQREDTAEAFRSVPRHLFVPGTPLTEVYSMLAVIPTHFDEHGLSISSSSAPNIMAIMLEQLDVHAGMRVLEIGAGTGYNAALLAHLAGERGEVVSVDIGDEVAAEARRHLADARVANVRVVHGDGWLGAPCAGSFDRIEATVGAWEISPHWFEQLRPGGILVMPLWLRAGLQVSVAFVRVDATLQSRTLYDCGFMRLRGPHAGPDAVISVAGWHDRVEGVTAEDHWIAAIEHATPERVARLHALIAGPVTAEPAPLPAPGWTARLALEEPDAIGLSGRDTLGHFAFGLFAPDHVSLAVFDAGKIVAFGDPTCADRLRARLPDLAPLSTRDLEIRAVPHPAGVTPDAWVLPRPGLDLVVRERG
jgi:protein-L-isoaspartate(D-aspartate) O-methyltransferase